MSLEASEGAASDQTAEDCRQNRQSDEVSSCVRRAHQFKKRDKYALLEAIVERQLISGLRSHAPRILPVAISTHGEFCAGAVELQDWLADKFERRLENEGSRDDG